jgi:glycosyltransferase involved in cell wall biosynthesis
MACALPILVSADGEAQRVVLEAQAGFVAPAEETGSFVDAICSFATLGKEQRKQMGVSAKTYSEKMFQKDTLITRLETILETIGKE